MRGYSLLVVLDETLAGDELDRVTQFLDDIATICPIKSVSGLIRHVEQQTPLIGVPLLAGDPSLAAQTGVALTMMSYTPWHPRAEMLPDEVLNQEQLRQHLAEVLWCCVNESNQQSNAQRKSLLPVELSPIIAQYDVVVCVRPKCGDGAYLTQGDQLICQLAETGQRPLWRCPRHYDRIRRVVVAWPDAETGPALLESGVRVANAWNIPFCVLSAGSKRHQVGIEESLRSACHDLGVPICDIIFGERLEDLSKSVNADDLLVMGAYGRWWPWRLITASHTETILQDLPCPALLVPSLRDTAACTADAGVNLWSASQEPRREAANACAPR